MESLANFSLKDANSFAIDSLCPQIYRPENLTDLDRLSELALDSFYLLGEGSNTLFIEQQAPIIIQPAFKGISVKELDDSYLIRVACGENWHSFVSYCVEQGYFGIENLALIPGSVGAAPVQNIGAYGVELADILVNVEFYHFASKSMVTLSNSDCQFAYRDSVFKHELKEQGLIVAITVKLSKNWQANLSYQGLNNLPENVTAKQVFEKVIQIRQSKLPNPKVIPNAGSFFKNPVVSQAHFDNLQKHFPEIAHYPLADGQVKLAAAWLIEQAGFKGYKVNGVGVHDKQALVLVNHSGTGTDIVALAKVIVNKVNDQFSVRLQPEVRMVGEKGCVAFEDIDG